MEFLKSCNTNAQAIGEFEAVAFQAFSVARNPTRSSSKTFDWDTSDDIRAVEAELREGNHLVIQDASRSWLWLFRGATVDQVGQPPPDLPTLADFHLYREHHGVVKGVELENRPIRPSNRSTPLSTSISSPVTAGSQKGLQPGTPRQSQGSTQFGTSEHQQYDAFAIYELFTSAVVALISFHLVKDYNAVALNYRTIVSSSTAQQVSDQQDPNQQDPNQQDPDQQGPDQQDLDQRYFNTKAPLRLTNVEVSWATAGTLLVSTFSLIKPDIHCLDEIAANDEQKQLINRCVRIAPNGILAKIMSFADPVDTVADDAVHRWQQKRPKVGLERRIERWKASAIRWLTWKGYSIPSLEKKSSWVRIQLAHTGQPASLSPAFSKPAREILWPRALCFYYGESMTDSHSLLRYEETPLHEADGLAWFDTPQSKGFTDHFDLAQQWFLGKAERDRNAEAQKKARQAEEDAERAKEENNSLFPSSPSNARAGAYGDLQSISGVYPTPPDGVPPGTVVSSGDTPSVSGLATNIILAPDGINPAINLSIPPENTPTDAQRQSPTSPSFVLPYEDYNADGNNDDLFEDMDEGSYDEGNGVTDADFNFFDEPDGEDIIMADASNVDETNSVIIEKVEEEPQVSAAPKLSAKEEPPDSMAALESALGSASADTQVDIQDKNAEQQSRNEESTASNLSNQLTDSNAQGPVNAAKINTPPLSPRFIETALLPSPKNEKMPPQLSIHHRDSVFDPLNFSRKMSLLDAKYKEGRFGFMSEKPKKTTFQADSHQPKSLRDLPLLTKLRYAIGVASTKNSLDSIPTATPDGDISDTSSETSSVADEDEDDIAPIEPGPLPGSLIVPTKRKLPTDGNATPLSTTSFAESLGGDFGELAGLQTDGTALCALEPTISDWSLIGIPPPRELPSYGTRYSIPVFQPTFSSVPSTPTSLPDLSMDLIEEKPLSGKDSIAIAQIVTDQIAPATLEILEEGFVTDYLSPPSSEARWQSLIQKIFPNAMDCNVAGLAAVADAFAEPSAQVKGQQRPPPRRPTDTATVLGHQMHQINTPYIRVRRADGLWDLSPSAYSFWEPLGLAPCSPAKNIVAFGIYPHSEALKPCVEKFLINMQLVYDSCRFGNHTRVDTVPEYAGGLVPCKLPAPASTRAAFKTFRDTCFQLGKILSTKHAQMRDKDDSKIDAFVIYIIDPFEQASALWELCSAFWTLFQAYGQGPPGRPDQVLKPDLVLQIVPIKYIASFETPVTLDYYLYAGLAREVYDRCPPSAPSEDKLPLSIYSAPSFQLEEAPPRAIPFKLTAEPPPDLFRDHSYIHIGYAISLDGAWMTVAWSDVCGKYQTMVSYNLGTRPFAELAKEVWQTTIEILQVRRIQWRICIAKAGVMEKDEMDAWMFLASCPTQISIFMALLTVDTEPHLRFIPPMPPPNTFEDPSGAGHSFNTPGSTPQAAVSPEQGLTPAATPSVDSTAEPANDPDARFVDMTDETWGIILAHRAHNSNSTTEFRPTLISGLLCKRGCSSPSSSPFFSPDPLVGPIVTGVNILWMGAMNPTRAATSPFPAGEGVSPGASGMAAQSPGPSPQERAWNSLAWTPTPAMRLPAENMLKEVLGHYRGLGLLARLKGVKGCRHGTVPWHVAVAVRGVKGLEICYPT
ncbi:mediator of RNA polymerase II transcription subunit 13 [Kalmusia sp. IMI 367209]|nr:mediator of RNA polymerase II transcription subunit 13 [Kalmusia sp. IMI 367209]